MGFHKTETGWVHIRTSGSKNKKCAWCGGSGDFLCDHVDDPKDLKLYSRTPKTCDKPMCLKHSTRVAVKIDFCPDHKDRPASES